MTWVKLDEEFAQHPKVVKAGPLGLALQVAALCYCNRYLTDGFIPRPMAAVLLDFSGLGVTWETVVTDLEAAGLWVSAEGGWVIHGYHDYQPTRAHVLELRETRRAVGSKGGRASGVSRAKQGRSKLLSKEQANAEANGQAKTNPGPVPVKEQPSVEQARRRDQVTQVFEAWKSSTGKVKARLDGKRDRRIRWALDNFPVEDVVDAVRGWQHSAHHRGENERRTVYNDLELLLRDAAHLERFRDLQRSQQPAAAQSERERQLTVTQAKLANSPWARKYNGGQPA